LRDFQVYIEDIIDAIDSIEEYTGQLTYESFAKDKKTVDVVVRDLEIIGEATKHIPERVRKEHSVVPWWVRPNTHSNRIFVHISVISTLVNADYL